MKNEIDIKIFSKNLKRIRNENKLSKKKMAKILHISTKTLTALENGILPPRVKANILLIIFKEFNQPPDQVFELKPFD